MLRKTGIIFADQFKRELIDKKIIAVLAAYVILLSIGMKYGVLLGQYAKLFLIHTTVPVEIIILYYISIIWLPILAVLLSFDLISGETSTNTISYLVIRANRSAVIVGKYLASAAVIAVVSLAAHLIALLYFFIKTDNLFLSDSVLSWLYLLFYAVSFVSTGIFCSTITKRNQTALWTAVTLLFVFLLMRIKDFLIFLSPFHYTSNLFQDKMIYGIAFFLLFSAVFIVLSIIIFKRKDV
jgi:ABC-type transport system involved in multi-copper enzyme maturation permease subunit